MSANRDQRWATLISLSVMAVGAVVGGAGVCTAGPPPVVPGTATTVAVEPVSGRVAICHNGKIEVRPSLDARPVWTFDVPNATAELVEVRGETITFSFALSTEEGVKQMAVALDGRERLLWPNSGIGELFPTADARLALDGGGLVQALVLDPAVRTELGVPSDAPDGAGVVASYRFVDEKLRVRFSEIFRKVVALTCEDVLITLKGGGMLRYTSPAGVAWKLEEGQGGEWRMLDVSTSKALALVLDGGGALRAVDIDKGTARWRWDPAEHADEVASYLTRARIVRRPAVIEDVPPGAPEPTPTAPVPVSGPTSRRGVLDARWLPDGRVLLLGDDGRRWLAALSPSTGELGGNEVITALDIAGLPAVRDRVATHTDNLSHVFAVKLAAGLSILVRGPDGWYAVPLD